MANFIPYRPEGLFKDTIRHRLRYPRYRRRLSLPQMGTGNPNHHAINLFGFRDLDPVELVIVMICTYQLYNTVLKPATKGVQKFGGGSWTSMFQSLCYGMGSVMGNTANFLNKLPIIGKFFQNYEESHFDKMTVAQLKKRHFERWASFGVGYSVTRLGAHYIASSLGRKASSSVGARGVYGFARKLVIHNGVSRSTGEIHKGLLKSFFSRGSHFASHSLGLFGGACMDAYFADAGCGVSGAVGGAIGTAVGSLGFLIPVVGVWAGWAGSTLLGAVGGMIGGDQVYMNRMKRKFGLEDPTFNNLIRPLVEGALTSGATSSYNSIFLSTFAMVGKMSKKDRKLFAYNLQCCYRKSANSYTFGLYPTFFDFCIVLFKKNESKLGSGLWEMDAHIAQSLLDTGLPYK